MKILIYDSETTGLFNKQEKDLDKQPHCIQFAGILVDMEEDGSYKEINRWDLLIKPPISIPYEASRVHNIYNGDVIDSKPFSFFARLIASVINNADIVVGHNIQFDNYILQLEYDRLKKADTPIDFSPKQTLCTMESSVNYCKLPRKDGNGYKRPKLQELVKKTLGEYFAGSHNAIVDTEWTLKALSVLVKEGVIKLEKEEEIPTLF